MPILDQYGRIYQASGPNNAAYRGGAVTRLTNDWQPSHRSGDSAIGENWDLLTSRIRDLFRNEPTIRNARRTLTKYVVGTGIQTFAAAMLNRDDYDDDFNDESDEEFERWGDDEADAENRMSWPEMQGLHFSQVAEVGESFLLKCSDDAPGRSIPLCYQILESEQIDRTREWPAGTNADGTVRNRCTRGIELNGRNQAIAYWIYDTHPYDAHQFGGIGGKSKRIPAERVLHTYLVERPSQTQGVTWFGCNVQTTRDLDWYIGNELTAAAIGALLTLIIKRKNGSGQGLGFAGPGETTDAHGNRDVKLGPGLIADIGAEDDVKVAESSRPNRDAAPFLKLIMMLQGMGVGLSYLRMTGDYSQSSYTSARGAHLDDHAFFVCLQSWFGRSAVRPVRQEHMKQAAAYGLYENVTPREFLKQQRRFMHFDLQPPGREQLDPEKETDAAVKRIDSCLSTHKKECGLRGDHWRRIFRQRAREMAFAQSLAKKAGVTLEQFVNLRANPPAPQQQRSRDEEPVAGDDVAAWGSF
jgi:lambda family phage portal protein